MALNSVGPGFTADENEMKAALDREFPPDVRSIHVQRFPDSADPVIQISNREEGVNVIGKILLEDYGGFRSQADALVVAVRRILRQHNIE